MKKPIIISIVFLFLLPLGALAHKPLLMVDDNEDGTIYVETGFSDGSSGAGHTILLKDAESGKVLEKATLPEESGMDLKKPSAPYIVVFDAGEGHVVETEGPAPSAGSESDEASEEEQTAAEEAPVTSEQPAVSSVPAPATVSAVSAYQAPPVNPGFGAVMQMMIGTQVFAAVGIIAVFGALMFSIGQRTERNRQVRK